MSQPDTKQRILDAAELLFAAEGFHNTSMRTLTGRAGVNLAAVNYHFGSKEALLTAVFERRLVPLNQARQERLQAVRESARRDGKCPSARDVLQAFVEPTLSFRESGPGAEAFVRLVGRAIVEPDDTIRTIFMRMMTPIFFFLYEILGEAVPDLPRNELFWRLHFALGVMSHTMCMAGRFQILPQGVAPPADAESLTNMVVNFIASGMESPCS